jgi:hypothetical protein
MREVIQDEDFDGLDDLDEGEDDEYVDEMNDVY